MDMDVIYFRITQTSKGYDITTDHKDYKQYKRLDVKPENLGDQLKGLSIQISNIPDKCLGVLFEME